MFGSNLEHAQRKFGGIWLRSFSASEFYTVAEKVHPLRVWRVWVGTDGGYGWVPTAGKGGYRQLYHVMPASYRSRENSMAVVLFSRQQLFFAAVEIPRLRKNLRGEA